MKKLYGTVHQNLTVEEGLNLLKKTKVVEMPLFYNFNSTMHNSKEFKAIVRQNDGSEVCVRDKDYGVLQHVDVYRDIVDGLSSTGLDWNVRSISINDFKKHSKVKMFFNFPELTKHNVKVTGSPIEYGFAITNSNDGSLSYSETLEALRLICTNGLTLSEEMTIPVKLRHTQSIKERFMMDMPSKLQRLISTSEKMEELFETALNTKIDDMIIKQLVKAGFPNRLLSNIDEIYEKYNSLYEEQVINPGTIYAYYQVLTNWVSNYVARNNLLRAQKYNESLMHLINQEQ